VKFNFDYEDMKTLTFEFNNEPLRLISKIYPENLEIKIDEETNTPYLYYEGVAMSNQGPVRVEFPRLDLVISHIGVSNFHRDEYEYRRYPVKLFSELTDYKFTTLMKNKPNTTMFSVKTFDKEDWEQAKDLFGIEIKEN
jgi:hypothetical protein